MSEIAAACSSRPEKPVPQSVITAQASGRSGGWTARKNGCSGRPKRTASGLRARQSCRSARYRTVERPAGVSVTASLPGSDKGTQGSLLRRLPRPPRNLPGSTTGPIFASPTGTADMAIPAEPIMPGGCPTASGVPMPAPRRLNRQLADLCIKRGMGNGKLARRPARHFFPNGAAAGRAWSRGRVAVAFWPFLSNRRTQWQVWTVLEGHG
jgi:hypothetical protein